LSGLSSVGNNKKSLGLLGNEYEALPYAQQLVNKHYTTCPRNHVLRAGMTLALYIDRCEVVAAFTNPTLHRTISQRFLLVR